MCHIQSGGYDSMVIPVRPRTLRRLILLCDIANKRKCDDIPIESIMKALDVSRRTAYDYLITLQYIRSGPASLDSA